MFSIEAPKKTELQFPHIILPKGMLLFRSAKVIPRNPQDFAKLVRFCDETGKTGLYFGTEMFLSAAMLSEYAIMRGETTPKPIGVYELMEELRLPIDKYAHRHIHPERYFTSDGKLKLDIDIVPDENISHAAKILALLDNQDGDIYQLESGGFEIFLNPHDAELLDYVTEYEVRPVLGPERLHLARESAVDLGGRRRQRKKT